MNYRVDQFVDDFDSRNRWGRQVFNEFFIVSKYIDARRMGPQVGFFTTDEQVSKVLVGRWGGCFDG